MIYYTDDSYNLARFYMNARDQAGKKNFINAWERADGKVIENDDFDLFIMFNEKQEEIDKMHEMIELQTESLRVKNERITELENSMKYVQFWQGEEQQDAIGQEFANRRNRLRGFYIGGQVQEVVVKLCFLIVDMLLFVFFENVFKKAGDE